MVAILDERKRSILRLLAERGSVQVKELAVLMKVTEATIRTDLNVLADQGKVERVHGAARLMENKVLHEYTYQARKNLNSEHKIQIGAVAASMVNDFDSILLDASTSALAMANALVKRTELKEITAIPLGIWTAIEMMGYDNFNILLPGGYLRHTSASIAGVPTQNFFDNLIIQKAFLGAWGVSTKTGLTDSHLLEVELKKTVISKAQEVIILADGSKFYQTGLASYAKIENVSTIITDHHADESEIKKIRKAGVEVIVCGTDPGSRNESGMTRGPNPNPGSSPG